VPHYNEATLPFNTFGPGGSLKAGSRNPEQARIWTRARDGLCNAAYPICHEL